MATNFVSASYNEIYDLNTQSGSVTTLKFHAPQGILPQQYLRGFWMQYKKYRYYGSKITMIPVATLPADPLQVSYAAGEPTIDPRDMVNPILHKVYRGEALVDDFAATGYNYSGVDQQIYDSGTNPTVGEDQYYATLQDPSWKKSHVQRGFRSRGIPLVRKVASNMQIGATSHFGDTLLTQSPHKWDPMDVKPQTSTGQPGVARDLTMDLGAPTEPYYDSINSNYNSAANENPGYTELFTSGWDKLGWLDTSQRSYSPFAVGSRVANQDPETTVNGQATFRQREMLTRLPRIFTYIALLPPSYKQEMYFRLVISHEFGFKDFRSASMPWDGATDMPFNVTPIIATPVPPTVVDSSSVDTSENAELKLASVGVS